MVTFISNSPRETFDLGVAWGRELGSGWVVGLSGDLGAGKTHLAKGIAAGLGSVDRVHSPTFALLNEYAGPANRIFHLDLYRLNGPEQVVGAGLEEYLLNPPGVSIVEWIERWLDQPGGGRPARLRRVTMESLDEQRRKITYEDAGD